MAQQTDSNRPSEDSSSGAAAGTTTKQDSGNQTERALKSILVLLLLGLAIIFIYAIWPGRAISFFSAFSIGVMVAGAAVLVGGLLGFLFGIPRSLQDDTVPAQPRDADGEGAANSARGNLIRQNTNLEQISDWLTKIIVGITLIRLREILAKLWEIASKVAQDLGGPPTHPAFTYALILFFLISGFLLGYLWTRRYLPREFRSVNDELLAPLIQRLNQGVKKIEEVKSQAQDIQRSLIGEGGGKEETRKRLLVASDKIVPGPDPEDPWRGQFGEKSENNNRRLRAEVTKVSESDTLFNLRLIVESTDQVKKPLRGVVRFFLHPTFNNDKPIVRVNDNGIAELNFYAYGAFTVGAVADKGETKLELNLATLPDAPTTFKMN